MWHDQCEEIVFGRTAASLPLMQQQGDVAYLLRHRNTQLWRKCYHIWQPNYRKIVWRSFPALFA